MYAIFASQFMLAGEPMHWNDDWPANLSLVADAAIGTRRASIQASRLVIAKKQAICDHTV